MAVKTCLKPPMSIITSSGSICTFNALQEGLPLKSHIVNIDNVSGVSAIKVSASSKNLVSWEHLNLHGWGGSDSTLVSQLNHLTEGTYTVQYKIKVISLQSGYTSGNYGLLLRAVNEGVNFNITMRADKTDVSEGDIFTYTATFTLTSDYVGKFTSAYYYTGRSPSNSSDYCDYYDFQIEKGIATPYEQPTDFNISIGQTVKAGTYNARSGLFIGDYDYVDLGSLTYQYTNGFFYTQEIRSYVKRPETNDDVIALRCNLYTPTSRNDLVNNLPNYSMAINTAGTLQIVNNDYSTPSAFKTAMSGVYLKYAVASPISLQLPPCPIDTNLGVNNIWADTGNTSLEAIKIGR